MIRNRNDLMEYLETHAPQPCIRRAVCEGQVEYLGMFSGLPPSGCNWLVVKVTSKHDKIWYVATAFHYLLKNPEPFVVKKVIWENWMGSDPDGPNPLMNSTPLMMGDYPKKYKELRDESNKQATSRS